ncbi:uroporphyrinogen decarboxylase family protein [Metaclostridioides mangenotii]|uniref:uroporphyrinogen decarboxylase family protein n=1 Tax=Metaclostridioides mangenotii TaxID=1540 RepID=UPI001F21B6B9|nr:uroporphyrinogen decarboxylase family protein [Clostridioides mangenotii]
MNYKINKDQMTPKERMQAFGAGKEIDRIPCSPFLGESVAPSFGYTIFDYNHSIDVLVDVAVKSFEKFRPDSIGFGPGLQGIPEAMGSEVSFPLNNTPFINKPAINDYSEIGKLRPIDPYKDGRIRYFLEALKITNDKLSKEVGVGTSVGGPFTAAAFIRGTDNFLRDLTKNKEKAHDLLEITTQSVINYIDAACDIGLTPSLAEPIASCTMISGKNFEEFAKPYLKKCMDRIIERTGGGSTLHICGKTKKVWGHMVDIGIANLSLDNIEDLGELKEAYGDKVCLIGNVDPVEIIMRGTIEDIYMEAKECIVKGQDSKKGFVLSTGCDVPIGTDPEKIVALMDAARIFGSRNININEL